MTDKIHALMVAAGKGSRFGAQIPKQYLTLADKTVLEHSVARLNHPNIDDLTLVIAKDDEQASGLDLAFEGAIHYAIGGAERWQSVHAGVAAIRGCGADDNDWVLIHDAARPCLPKQDLQDLLDALSTNPCEAVILAAPVVDTLKQVVHDKIVKTVDRSALWQAQTPQAFRLKALEEVLSMVAKTDMLITDEASGFEMMGREVQIVTGSRLNMKLTYAEDLPLLEAVLTYLLD